MFKLSEFLVLMAVGYLMFNKNRVGQLFGMFGSSVRAFRKGLTGGEDDRPTRSVN